MARRIDKIFRALENAKRNNNVQENVIDDLTPTALRYPEINVLENNVDIAGTIQKAEIVFLNSEGQIDYDLQNVMSQTSMDPCRDSYERANRSMDQPSLLDEPLSSNNGGEMAFATLECIQSDCTENTVELEREVDQCNQMFSESSCLKVNQKNSSAVMQETNSPQENLWMEPESNDDDSDFQPHSEDSGSQSSENVSVLRNDEINADVQDEVPKRKRSIKYEVNKNKWQENRNRLNREKGKSYTGKKKENGKWRYDLLKEPRSLKGNCNCKLSQNNKSVLKCRKLSEIERTKMFKEFWQLTWPEKKMFVRNHVLVHGTSRKRGVNDESRRAYSNQFFLGSYRLRVCKTMFLNTLGVKEWVIKKWAKIGIEENDVQLNQQKLTVSKNVELLHTFFESLPKLESHYCRASTSKLYLEPTWRTKSQLYKFYKQEFCNNQNNRSVSIATFHKEFEKSSLSLYRPKKDLCDVCVSFETGNITEIEYNYHAKLKDEARAEKNKDKHSQNDVFTMDLQSVLLCPKSNVSSLYYKTKLVVHNFTIYDIKRQKGFCYLWNESEGGLTSNEFTSIIIHFLKRHVELYFPTERNTDTEIILWSDGCGYQNRNTTLSNGLFNFALESGITVVQKYLQKGHTQMEVDSVHSVIERQIRNKKINVPADYVYICKTACHKTPYTVEYLMHNFFLKYDKIQYFKSIRPGKIAGAPTVNDLRALKYTKDGVFFKLRHTEDWQTLPIRLNTSNIVPINSRDLPLLHKNRLKIKAEKYQHLQQLKTSMERDYHDFYDKLPHE